MIYDYNLDTECNKLCLHLHLSRAFVRDQDFRVYELAYCIALT